MNQNLINFYRVVRNEKKYKKLIRFLEYTPYARDAHKETIKGTDIEKAGIWFASLRMSFGNREGAPLGSVPKIPRQSKVVNFTRDSD